MWANKGCLRLHKASIQHMVLTGTGAAAVSSTCCIDPTPYL
jgi:hypothetical protein